MSNGTKASDAFDIFDPWGMFRIMRDACLESTAKTMVEFINTEEYARASGAMLDAYLDFAEPIRRATDAIMPSVLAHYGLPSRKELISVASRMSNIEMRLDDMEAMLQEIRDALRDCPESLREAA